MGSFEEMEVKQRLLQHITQALVRVAPAVEKTWSTGRTMGLKVPEDIRARIEAQGEIWELGNFKRTVMTAIMLGLDQLEYLHNLKGKEHSNGRQDFVPKVPRVFGSNGPRDRSTRGG